MALISKILEDTLTAGNTTIVFTDADIPNSLIRVYTTDSNIYPTTVELSGTSITATFEAQSSNIGVALEIVKSGISVIDDILTQDSDNALSANQGYVLSTMITSLSNSIPDNITDMDDINITSIQDGQILSWDETSQKFVNVDNSASGEVVYSTTEEKIGEWIDGSDLYEKTIEIQNIVYDTSWHNISHDISDLDTVISSSGILTSNTGYFYPIPSYRSTTSYGVTIEITSSTINYVNNWVSTCDTMYITLRYTKTS